MLAAVLILHMPACGQIAYAAHAEYQRVKSISGSSEEPTALQLPRSSAGTVLPLEVAANGRTPSFWQTTPSGTGGTQDSYRVKGVCLAPYSAELMYTESPSCKQLWASHIHRELATTIIRNESDLLQAQLGAEISAQKWEQNALDLGNSVVAILGSPTAAMVKKNYLMESGKHIASALLIDGTKPSVAAKAVDTVANIVMTRLEYMATGPIGVTGAIQPGLDLAKAILATYGQFQLDRIIEEFNNLHVTREYLWLYYHFGMDDGAVARKYGLAEGASVERIIRAIGEKEVGKNTLFDRKFHVEHVVSEIKGYKDLIGLFLRRCRENGCGLPDVDVVKGLVYKEMEGGCAGSDVMVGRREPVDEGLSNGVMAELRIAAKCVVSLGGCRAGTAGKRTMQVEVFIRRAPSGWEYQGVPRGEEDASSGGKYTMIEEWAQKLCSVKGGDGVGSGELGVDSEGGGTIAALMIDRSGSMEGEKVTKAKEGARAFVSAMEPSSRIAVTSFSATARTDAPLASQEEIQRDVGGTLDAIGPGTVTNVGEGLAQGYKELESGASASGRFGMLLSDGKNNRGEWQGTAERFAERGWPVFTIGYGEDADTETLHTIASMTEGIYWSAAKQDIVDAYWQITQQMRDGSVVLSTNDVLGPGEKLAHQVRVSRDAERLAVQSSWQGSRLRTTLRGPGGQRVGERQLRGEAGNYDAGDTFELLEVEHPAAGEWEVRIRWQEPPQRPEQVNVSVAEETDVMANVFGLEPEYRRGEPVDLDVQFLEATSGRRRPLHGVDAEVEVQKPGGPRINRMIQARSSNWRMYKHVMESATREVDVFDDGAHDDYRPGDGVYGGRFTETDENGIYIVTARLEGRKQDGRRVRRTVKASFQVGPIHNNRVTTSQVLGYRELVEERAGPLSEEKAKRQDPRKAIQRERGDPLSNIERLMQGQ